MLIQCPLCLANILQSSQLKTNDLKIYYDCTECRLVFLDPLQTLSHDEEKKRYQLHENDINDLHYQNFVSDITNFISVYTSQKFLTSKALGLDFGAGPGPVMTKVLENQPIDIKLFDPYFHQNPEVLQLEYDFIICCEVIEHFYHPAKEFITLRKLLKSQSPLILKTEILYDNMNFDHWYYRKDPTHVCFYRTETFDWIFKKFNYKRIQYLNKRCLVLWS